MLVRAEACRVKARTVVGVLKNVSCVIQVGIRGVNSRLGSVFEDDSFCNFYITISELNSMSPVFLKDSLIIFFLNACKRIVIIQAKNSSFENS